MTDYVEYFANYTKGETDAMQKSMVNFSSELDVTVPLLQLLDKKVIQEVDANRLDFFRYKSQATKGIFLSISSILRLHRFQAFGDLRYALDAMTLSCLALNDPKQLNEIILKHGDKSTAPGDYTKKHTALSESIFRAAKNYLESYDKQFNKNIFDVKAFTSTYGSHVFIANTNLNTNFNIPNTAYQNIFDEPTVDYIQRSRQSLLLIGSVIFKYIHFLYRNGGKGKIILYDRMEDLSQLGKLLEQKLKEL